MKPGKMLLMAGFALGIVMMPGISRADADRPQIIVKPRSDQPPVVIRKNGNTHIFYTDSPTARRLLENADRISIQNRAVTKAEDVDDYDLFEEAARESKDDDDDYSHRRMRARMDKAYQDGYKAGLEAAKRGQ